MRYLLFITALLLVNLTLSGQTVKISYSEKMETDTPTLLSMELDQKTYLKAVIQGDFSSKKSFALTHYKCQDGVVRTPHPVIYVINGFDSRCGFSCY